MWNADDDWSTPNIYNNKAIYVFMFWPGFVGSNRDSWLVCVHLHQARLVCVRWTKILVTKRLSSCASHARLTPTTKAKPKPKTKRWPIGHWLRRTTVNGPCRFGPWAACIVRVAGGDIAPASVVWAGNLPLKLPRLCLIHLYLNPPPLSSYQRQHVNVALYRLLLFFLSR